MVSNDALLAAAMAATDDSTRGRLLEELEDRLRHGDTPAEYTSPEALRTTKLPMECFTCAYATYYGGTEARDREHQGFDGAHEPGWYAGEEGTCIRNDLELIRFIVANGVKLG